MAQTYTLDEAAARIGIPVEEFKRRWKTEWTTVRTFRDGGTVRFRSADIDELARTLGQASDPGLQMAPPKAGADKSSTEFLLPDDAAVGDDIFNIGPSDSAKRRGKPADSDIRLEADAGPKSARRKNQDATPTEELSLDLSQPPSGKRSSGKLTAPKSSMNLKKEDDSSSEFELSLDSDSDSFELTLNPDGSDEVDLGGASKVTKRGGAGASGINLERPADSGISLESDSDELELSLDEPTSQSGRKLTGPKSVKMPKLTNDSDSDSEFELTLDDNSGLTDKIADEQQGDIFETDFELPVEDAESGSEVVAVENSDTDLENSDFDLALDESDIQADDESASQVVLLDDEPAPKAKARKLAGGRKPADDDDAIDIEDDDASAALRDVPKRRRDYDDEEDVAPAAAKPKPWGALPAVVLLPCFILTFLGGLMSYELLKGMWSYNSGQKPTGSLVRGVAETFDMKPND